MAAALRLMAAALRLMAAALRQYPLISDSACRDHTDICRNLDDTILIQDDDIGIQAVFRKQGRGIGPKIFGLIPRPFYTPLSVPLLFHIRW